MRLLAPAAGAWATAWGVMEVVDLGIDPVVVAWTLWGVGALALALVLVSVARGASGASGATSVGTQALAAAGRLGATAVVVLGASALVASSAAAALAQRADSSLTDAATSGRAVGVVVDVIAAPRELPAAMWAGRDEPPRLRVDGRVVAVDGRAEAPVVVTTTLDGARPRVSLGARLALVAHVTRLPAMEEAGFRLRPVDEVGLVDSAPPWFEWSVGLRSGLAAAAAPLGGDGAALVPGLAIGDTSAVGDELDAAMKASSLSHLTAVSGANCAIVTAVAFAIAALCRMRRAWRVVVALTALVGFVILVTPQPSVIRASAMAIVVLAAIALGRPGGGVAALGVAVIGLIASDPWLARDFGFALSAAATAGLLLLAGPLSQRLARVMPVPLATVIAVPLAAQLACQPVLVLLDPAIALYGVPANLLAAPAAPVSTVVGLTACILLPLLPSVGVAVLQVAWVPASWIALVAHGAAGLPGGRVPWLPEAQGAALLAVATGLGLWLLLSTRQHRGSRTVVAGVLVVALGVPVGVTLGSPLVAGMSRPANWDVAACDIGQGDAVLIRSADATALIDTGPEPAALERCLTLLAIDRIDLLVMTHWDADHAGGVQAVVGRVGLVIHGPLDGDRSRRVLGPLTRAGADAVEVVAGHHGILGDARWRVLWPKPGASPGNDASVVLDLDAPEYRGVFLGDLGEGAQARMLRSPVIGPVDLVKVAHHGSADQDDALYRELDAGVGIIGVGPENGYGHPTDRLLDLLAAVGTTPVRTDLGGTSVLTATSDGAFGLWSERAGGVGARP